MLRHEIFNKATKIRHNKLVKPFINGVYRIDPNEKEIQSFNENVAIVYNNNIKNNTCNLFYIDSFDCDGGDAKGLDELMHKIKFLNYVQPDFMFFRNNVFVTDEDHLKIAGTPDFLLEVWSESNSEEDIEFKKDLYKNSKNIEHWYLTQHSNDVECWFENKRLDNKNLKDVLTTLHDGIAFDLRHLALE